MADYIITGIMFFGGMGFSAYALVSGVRKESNNR